MPRTGPGSISIQQHRATDGGSRQVAHHHVRQSDLPRSPFGSSIVGWFHYARTPPEGVFWDLHRHSHEFQKLSLFHHLMDVLVDTEHVDGAQVDGRRYPRNAIHLTLGLLLSNCTHQRCRTDVRPRGSSQGVGRWTCLCEHLHVAKSPPYWCQSKERSLNDPTRPGRELPRSRRCRNKVSNWRHWYTSNPALC